MKYWHSRSGFFTRPVTASLILLLALGAGAPLAGCASEQDASPSIEHEGSLGLNLEVAPGVTLLSVSYTITGNGFTKTGTIDVGDSPVISGTIGGIPAGNGYTIELSATSVEDKITFTGSANFDVTAGQTTSVSIHLTGDGGGSDTGSVSVNGNVSLEATINVGPAIDEFTVTPLTVFVGGEVTLEAVANDPDDGPSPLSYSWSASRGVIESPTAPSTTLTSVTSGTSTVTLTVSDGGITSTKTTTVTFVDTDEDEDEDEGSGGATSTGGAPGTGGTAETGGAPGTGGTAETGGTPAAGGTAETGGTGAEPQEPLTLVATAAAPNTANLTSTVLPIPSGVAPGDTAVVFVLVTGTSAQITGSPQGFVTTQLAAAQHNLSYGQVGDGSSLTWTSTPSATTGATAFFFRGASIAVEVRTTDQPSGNTFGLPASSQAPQAAFASGYALFGIQLPVSSTPTISAGPAAPWQGPVTDGRQLFTWVQPYVSSAGAFLFPAASGTLSASAVKRQAQVFVSSPSP